MTFYLFIFFEWGGSSLLSDGMACHSPALEKAKKQGKMPF